jgi:F-type H+-transporting ATPase subunit gamma
MVAASRLRGAQTAMEAFRPYADKFAEVLGSLAGRAGEEVNPLLLAHEEVKKIHIVLFTSDRGLCGGFNVNLIDKAQGFMKAKADQDLEFSFTNFGRKGRDWCRKNNCNIDSEHVGVVGADFSFNIAQTAGRTLIDGFIEGQYDEVHIVFAEFLTMAKQVPVLKQILPLGEMLPRNVYVQLYSALLETSTSEHAARMMAMDNATKACNDMLDNLTLIYNKARQAAITAELMDIVGGAEALKG